MKVSVLFVATVCRHVHGFHRPYLRLLKRMGYDVIVAARYDGTERSLESEGYRCVNIPFCRKPLQYENLREYTALCDLLRETPLLKLVHVHTPVAAFLARMALRQTSFSGKVLYTAHGFHFYNGASPVNWMLYYPLEVLAARYTDGIITINHEDYERALRFRLRPNGRVYYVPGVGVDLACYSYQGDGVRSEVRDELGIKDRDTVITCVAEINGNKNQIQLVRAMELVKGEIPGARLLLVGEGPYRRQLEAYVLDRDLRRNVLFLGHRNDIPRLLTASDIGSLVSRREGLSRFVMEAAAAGLPLVGTDIRGNRDIIVHGRNGYLVPVGDSSATARWIVALARDEDLRRSMGRASVERARAFSLDRVLPMMQGIYHGYLPKNASDHDHGC